MPRMLALLITTTLAVGCAGAAAELGFPRVDSDDDDRVDRSEFAEFMDDVDAFDRYDDDDDDALDMTEYREAVESDVEGTDYFRGFDRDRSNGLSESEFADGIFGVYDANGDGWLSDGEFEAAVAGLTIEI